MFIFLLTGNNYKQHPIQVKLLIGPYIGAFSYCNFRVLPVKFHT